MTDNDKASHASSFRPEKREVLTALEAQEPTQAIKVKLSSLFKATGQELWNNFPAVLKPLESDAEESLHRANEIENPYRSTNRQVEYHISRARAALDECFRLRQGAHEMEIEAVKATWNKVLTDLRTSYDETFDEEFYKQRALASSEQYNPEQRENQEHRTPRSSYERIRTALGRRRSLGLRFEEALADRRSVEYSAFNYVARHEQIRKRFTPLLIESYLRCRACADVLGEMYRIDVTTPSVHRDDADADKDLAILDKLDDWLRNVSAKVEQALASDTEFDIDFWLRSDKLGMTWNDKSLAASSGTFNIPAERFPLTSGIRLHSLRVSVLMKAEVPIPSQFRFLIKPPSTEMKVPGTAHIVNSKILNLPVEVTSNILANRNPIGAWVLEFVNNGEGSPPETKFGDVQDILVGMRVAAISR